jgi:hypothetical protein
VSSRLEKLPQSAEAFLHAGIYLRNWSPRTVRTYRQAYTILRPTASRKLSTLRRRRLVVRSASRPCRGRTVTALVQACPAMRPVVSRIGSHG